MTAILTAQDLVKAFGDRVVLAGASFAMDDRDRIGLIGVNGSGKSTLLRMLTGDGEPDDGLITRRRDLRLEYVPQEPRLDPAATVAQALDRGPEVPAHEIRGLGAALGVPPADRVIGTLSIGERRRVALARALLADAELLALDEPTNHLDARTVEWLETRLASFPGALLVVTHDRYFLDRVATRILELDRGQLHAYQGNYAAFLERQAERMAIEARHESARAAFVRRELDWIRRGPSARGTKQKARIERFDEAVAARPGAADRAPQQMALRLPTGGRLGKTILELRGAGKRVPSGDGERWLFRGLTLTMKPGDRIGVVGPNGAGKTTLIRTILGLTAADEGEVVLGVNTRPAYLEQGRSDLRDDATVLDEVAGGDDTVYLEDGPIHVRTFLRMLLFADSDGDRPVGSLSGGERNRVQLAKLLRRGGNLVVLDEPTNDLDLLTLGALEDALVAFPGCALVVSHDRWFLDRVATGILAFEEDGNVVFYEGDYSSYQAKRRAAQAARPAAAAEAALPAAQRPRRASEGPRRITYKERQELSAIEALILGAEARVTELEATLSDPAVFKERGAEVPGLVAALDAARGEVERLYARWHELEELARASPP
ncbi:MAG TPA: ABC-F family ATP-binding cassette domain-containing protein [Kofleriaceae bacterium]|nr:ABC-F family ATP-binding cassette domain-containing protein [Kofleriaceae bacterium]